MSIFLVANPNAPAIPSQVPSLPHRVRNDRPKQRKPSAQLKAENPHGTRPSTTQATVHINDLHQPQPRHGHILSPLVAARGGLKGFSWLTRRHDSEATTTRPFKDLSIKACTAIFSHSHCLNLQLETLQCGCTSTAWA